MKEYQDLTLQSLEPEFSRIRISHEQEMSDLELKYSNLERTNKNEIKTLFKEKLISEEKKLKDDMKSIVRARLDRTIAECSEKEREYKARCEDMSEELHREYNKYKIKLMQQLDEESDKCEEEYKKVVSQLHSAFAYKQSLSNNELRDVEKEHSITV